MSQSAGFVHDLEQDDLGVLGPGPLVVLLGEVMVRDTPADGERPERTRLVHLSPAGSEYSVAVGLARLGLSAAFVSRLPDNPYGWAVRNVARENGVDTRFLVWAPAAEPIGRMLYEPGKMPRPDTVLYQRMGSAASRLDAGMVDWGRALAHARILHTTGITLGLAAHSGYARNYMRDAFLEAVRAKPKTCRVAFDLNYRSTLWPLAEARRVVTPVLEEQVDWLITTPHDMAQFYDLPCGRYSARQILAHEVGPLDDADLCLFGQAVRQRLNLQLVAVTLRHPDAPEQHHWESAAIGPDGRVYRSSSLRAFSIQDRLGGGDAWTAGFYYGLLTAPSMDEGLLKGITVGDACTSLKHTLNFDLPILERREVNRLLQSPGPGWGRVQR